MLNLRLDGRVAIVTGGSRGIGRAIAERLGEAGAAVAVIYVSGAEEAESSAAQIRSNGSEAEIYQCNVADSGKCAETVAEIKRRFGRVDILVNNAGITRDALTPMMSEESFDAVVSVNLKGAFNMIKAVSRELIRHGGRVINITSVSALTGNVGQINYSAAKAGLIGMTKTVAREFALKNVTCNAIAPGFIDSDMTKSVSGEARETFMRKIPLGRAGSPSDIAETAAFLASDAAAYITGEVIRVDGGMCM